MAALLVLAAFSGYCAEGVLAAFCAPGSPQHGEPAVHASHGPAGSAYAATSASADAGASHGHDGGSQHGHGDGSQHGHAGGSHEHAGATSHAHAGAPHGHAGAASHGHEGAAHGPAVDESRVPAPAGGPHHSHCPFGMAGGVSCTAVSLPGHGVAVVPLPASSERNVVPPQVNIPLLLDRSLYHPPRA
jgi:hypothetical protein